MGETVTLHEEKFLRPKQRREDSGGEDFQRMLKRIFRVALRVLLLFSLLFFGHRVYSHFQESPFFRVREIQIEGCQKVAVEVLLGQVRLEGMSNLFTFNLKRVARRLEAHPWIEQVRVRKVFPNKILVEVTERKPIAILQLGDLYYIDAKGVVFAPVGDRDEYDFPFLTGLTRPVLENDSEEARELIMKALELLGAAQREKVPPLETLSEIHMEMTFGVQGFGQTGGVGVRMGWEGYGEKLKRLSIIWSDLQKRGLSASSIDCSDPKRVIVNVSANLPGPGRQTPGSGNGALSRSSSLPPRPARRDAVQDSVPKPHPVGHLPSKRETKERRPKRR